MNILIYVSLLLNIAVLLPVCAGLISDASWVAAAYGGPSPARGILTSLYVVIGLASIVLLVAPMPRLVAGLLILQVTYKVMTPVTVGSLANPVVVSNLIIAAVHSVTLVAIWQSRALKT